MEKYQENIVPATGQNSENVYIYGQSDFRVLFVGNSITKHRPKPEIGWDNDCGMAASAKEKDYVHLLMQKIRREYRADASFAIATAADFERGFMSDDFWKTLETRYAAAKDYRPHIILMFFGANVPDNYESTASPTVKFGDAYERFRNYFCGAHSRVFHAEGFYIRPKLDAEKAAVAKKHGDAFVSMKDVRERDDTHGKFNHPSDIGMREIANAFWEAIRPTLGA